MFANLRYCKLRVVLISVLFIASMVIAQEYRGSSATVSTSQFKAKSDLTKTQEKLSTDLLQLIDKRFLQNSATLQSHIESMKRMKQLKSDQPGELSADQVSKLKVYVYIKLQPEAQTNQVEALLSEVTDIDIKNSLWVAWVKVANLEKIASLDDVQSIRTVVPPLVRIGSVTTEGDTIHKTFDVRAIYSQSGSGMKVGIISDGVDTRSAAQATGDLPADGSGLTVLSNTQGGDEGTAMLEIVHDMVPDADLYFHDCGSNVVAFNSAIDNLIGAGCDVICDDIGWLLEPFYEDGTIASHVASVLSGNDMIYVSSAGNAGNSHYQGDYYSLNGGTQHDFSSGGTSGYYLYLNMPAGSSVIVVLQWNDQFGLSGNDYDLYLFNMSTSLPVVNSLNVQNGDDDPLEYFAYTASSSADYAIVVDKYSGSAKNLEVYIYPSGSTSIYTNNITPVDAIFGHPAAVGAVAVGAVRVTLPSTIESFSSQGPCTITYPSPVSRAKPDIVGVDGGVITGAGSFGSFDGLNWRFYGTSASAPHVAAVCAQFWAQFPSYYTGNEVRDKILAACVDLGDPGYDNVFGYGRADALAAFDGEAQPVLCISDDTYEEVKGGGTKSIQVDNCGTGGTFTWTASGDQPWISVLPTSGNPGDSFTITVADNPGTARNGIVTVTAPGIDGSPKYVTVNQAGNGCTPPNWTVNPGDFEHTMALIGVIFFEDVESMDTSDIVAAFVGTECRGIAKPTLFPATGRYTFGMTIYSNVTSGEIVKFKAFDYSECEEWDVRETYTFLANDQKGNDMTPEELHAGGHTQQISLNSGWNWISINVTIADMSLNTVLESIAPNGEFIKDQTSFATYYPPPTGWYSSNGLNAMDPKSMYMLKMGASDQFELTGTDADINTSISLNSGWNWIGYIPQGPIAINTALASIAPNGDFIKNQTSFATYYDPPTEWYSSNGLDEMVPGVGYMLKMGEADNLIYPAADAPPVQKAIVPDHGIVDLDWSPDVYKYEHSMAIIGVVFEGASERRDAELVVGAFVGEECRSLARLAQFPLNGRYEFNILVHGQADEEIRFKVFDVMTKTIKDCDSSVLFAVDSIIGNGHSPFALKVASLDLAEIPTSYRLYQNHPNPFNPSTTIAYDLAEAGNVRLKIYDIRGQHVRTLQDGRQAIGHYEIEWDSRNQRGLPVVSGLYFYKIECNNFIQTRKMLFTK